MNKKIPLGLEDGIVEWRDKASKFLQTTKKLEIHKIMKRPINSDSPIQVKIKNINFTIFLKFYS